MQLRTAGFGAVVPCPCPHEAPQSAALLALDWTSFIIELALVAKVLYKHQLQLRSYLGYLWAARAQLRASPTTWAFIVLQLRRVYVHTYWMRGAYDWCAACWFCVLLSSCRGSRGCPDLVHLAGALPVRTRRRRSCWTS